MNIKKNNKENLYDYHPWWGLSDPSFQASKCPSSLSFSASVNSSSISPPSVGRGRAPGFRDHTYSFLISLTNLGSSGWSAVSGAGICDSACGSVGAAVWAGSVVFSTAGSGVEVVSCSSTETSVAVGWVSVSFGAVSCSGSSVDATCSGAVTWSVFTADSEVVVCYASSLPAERWQPL